MKTINFELSKRLNDLWLLDNIETEWKIQLLPTKIWNKWNKWRLVKNWNWKWKIYKTLTLEEAIEFLPNWISMQKDWGEYIYYYFDYIWNFSSKNHIEVIEKLLEYLLDNDLLTK